MKTIKITENGVEIECYLIPVEKENLGKVSEYLNTVSTIKEGYKLEIPSRCEKCNAMFIFGRPHQCGIDLTKPKFEVWKPKVGEKVYFIEFSGKIGTDLYDINEIQYRFFKTEAEAIEAREKALFNYEVEMFIKEKNEGWVPDYSSIDNVNFNLNYDFERKKFIFGLGRTHKVTNDSKVFKTREIGEEVLAKFDNDKLLKYWI